MFLFFIIGHFEKFRFGHTLSIINDFSKLNFLDSRLVLILSLVIFSIIGIPPLIGFFPKFYLLVNLFFVYSSTITFFVLFWVIVAASFYLRWILFLNVGDFNTTVGYIRFSNKISIYFYNVTFIFFIRVFVEFFLLIIFYIFLGLCLL